MLVNTHVIIADIVRKNIFEKTNIKLSKNHFRYGNIKPDLKRKSYNVSHNFEGSFDVVSKLLTELFNDDFEINSFSVKLGVICHFISDWFCSYHAYNELASQSLLKHLIFEFQLHMKFFKFKISKDFFNKSVEECYISSYTILNDLKKVAKEYYTKKRSLENDLKFSIMASKSISLFVAQQIRVSRLIVEPA